MKHNIVKCNYCDDGGYRSSSCTYSELRGGRAYQACPPCDLKLSNFNNQGEYSAWISTLATTHPNCSSCPLKARCLTISMTAY
jgi:hypothetical protein